MSQIFKLKKLHMTLFMFNLLLALWMAGGVNFRFYEQVAQFGSYQGLAQFLFLLVTFFIIGGLYLLVLQLFSWQRTAKFVAIFFIVLTAGCSYFVNQLGIDITKEQIQNVAQTDVNEAMDLLSVPLFIHLLQFLVIPAVVVLMIDIKAKPLKSILYQKLLTIITALFLIGVGLFSFYGQYAPIFREHRELKGQISPFNVISNGIGYVTGQFKRGKQPLVPFGTDAHRIGTHTPKVVLLIVGETTRAQNFGLNGYARNTTPELSALNVINFKQVSSCGTQTSVSVPCMFSGMPRKSYDEDLASHREGLLDIAQRAGYQVTWIDNNSGCKGACDRIKSYISPKDDPAYKTSCVNGECYDEVLLDALNTYLDQLDIKNLKQDQLIVLHQIGSHGPAYYKRYPKAYEQFKPVCQTNNIQDCNHDQLINTYDNTVLYTDHIVASTIQRLKKLDIASSLYYVSDHGESTGESGMYLHGAPYLIAPKEQTHVPMVMWFSDQWPKKSQYVACLQQQANDAISHDHLFPTMLSLLQIQTQVLNPKLDLLNHCQGI